MKPLDGTLLWEQKHKKEPMKSAPGAVFNAADELEGAKIKAPWLLQGVRLLASLLICWYF